MRIVHLLRKPLGEASVAANVLQHGTGAVNIDAARIATSESTERRMGHNAYLLKGGDHGSIIASHQSDESKVEIEVRKYRPDRDAIATYLREARERKGMSRNAVATALGVGTSYYTWEATGDANKLPSVETWWRLKDFLGFDDRHDAVMTEMTTVRRHLRSGGGDGRWPANLVVQHLPGCKHVGSRRVRGQSPQYRNDGRGRGVDGVYGSFRAGRPRDVGIGHADEDGMETVEAWECVRGCPVADIDHQSGDVPAGSWCRQGDGCHPFGDAEGSPYRRWKDVQEPPGGASRFFKQVGGADDGE